MSNFGEYLNPALLLKKLDIWVLFKFEYYVGSGVIT